MEEDESSLSELLDMLQDAIENKQSEEIIMTYATELSQRIKVPINTLLNIMGYYKSDNKTDKKGTKK